MERFTVGPQLEFSLMVEKVWQKEASKGECCYSADFVLFLFSFLDSSSEDDVRHILWGKPFLLS